MVSCKQLSTCFVYRSKMTLESKPSALVWFVVLFAKELSFFIKTKAVFGNLNYY